MATSITQLKPSLSHYHNLFAYTRIRRDEDTYTYRNRGFQEARASIVVSLDDDAYLTDKHTLARIVALFSEFPQAGAFALPYGEPRCDHRIDGMPPLAVGTPLRNYVGCAHAARRQVALKAGGYPELLGIKVKNDTFAFCFGT